MRWVSELIEDVEFTPKPGLSLERAPAGRRVEDMLAEGGVDACLHADVIDPIVEGDPRVGRLFENYAEVERAYFRRTGIFPIMHVTAIRRELVDAHPWLAQNLIDAFEASKAAAYARLRNPRIVPLAWYNSYRDEEAAFFGGADPWQYGLGEANRRNLETAIRLLPRLRADPPPARGGRHLHRAGERCRTGAGEAGTMSRARIRGGRR